MSEKEEFSKLSFMKKCPVCGGELEKGYIHAPRGVYWDTKRHKFLLTSTKGLISMWAWTIPHSPALRCERCGIAIFDYGKRELMEETPKSFLKKCVECGREIPIASEECQYCGTKQPKYKP